MISKVFKYGTAHLSAPRMLKATAETYWQNERWVEAAALVLMGIRGEQGAMLKHTQKTGEAQMRKRIRGVSLIATVLGPAGYWNWLSRRYLTEIEDLERSRRNYEASKLDLPVFDEQAVSALAKFGLCDDPATSQDNRSRRPSRPREGRPGKGYRYEDKDDYR